MNRKKNTKLDDAITGEAEDFRSTYEMRCNTTTDTSTPSDVLRQFTPPSQQGIETRKEPTVIVQMWASVQMSGGVCQPVSRPYGYVSLLIFNSKFENLQIGDKIANHNLADRTTVPISRIFDHFRNLRINNIQSDNNSQTMSTTYLPLARIQSHHIPASDGQTSNVNTNVRSCLTTGQLNIPNSGERLPTPSQHHFHTTDRAIVVVSIIFDRFRNMSRTGFHTGDEHDIVRQLPVSPFSHAYLCLDVKDCVIRPEIISFLNSRQENRPLNDLPTEHSRGHTRSTHNKGNAFF
ncbi:hypothetical protein Tco_1413955 [Tanacetum coccineum]